MSFDVQISEQADQDLRDIYEYIAFELLTPENAVGQLDRLEEAKVVTVIRIMYGGRDVDKQLNHDTEYKE
ncbi:MAG: hypothetical protein NC430_13135 [bacterium]|nr:hypothetical protein [bacterium]